ncbi:MAG: Sapep family Mn(2+)-dependent dipeptidase, partial [Lachnospiraceae bacterium]|nr:Sapep family Mn(2+)-dependent dipeptidase [Lachnospiraceae bacterium]
MKEKIQQWLAEHREQMIRDIFDLVRIPSERMPAQEGMPYGEGPAQALALALSKAQAYGFAVQNHENYVGSIDLSDAPRGLDILAHLDVVPATPGFTVTKPFEPVEKDGKLYGRGTADDKGPAVAALYAMRALKELGVPLTKNVRLILGCDEECGSSDIEYYYKKEAAAPCTFSPDSCFPVVNVEKGHLVAAFVCKSESGNGCSGSAAPCIVRAHSGMKFNVIPDTAQMQVRNVSRETLAAAAKQLVREIPVQIRVETLDDSLRITVKGKSAHASTPELGVNALTAMLRLLHDVKDAFAGADDPATKALLALSDVLVYADHAGRSLRVDRDHEVTGPTTVSPDMLDLA